MLWIEPYPTRFPQLSDIRRLQSTPQEQAALIETPSWLQIQKSRGLPIEPLPGSWMINRPLWSPVFQSVQDFVAQDGATQLVVGKPSLLALGVLKQFSQCPSIYDAMDDFPAFYEGISRFAFARRERLVAKQANVIWASSSELEARWSAHHSNVRLVLNGLDLTAMPSPSTPKNLGNSRPKVFGYVGTIASWFDWEWVIELADKRPRDEVRLIGPVYESANGSLPANIRMLPARDHAAALSAMQDFDVALIPFKRNQLTSSVDPIKYYEYRALALPILSTDFGEMSCRANESGVFISHSIDDVTLLSEQALAYAGNNEFDASAFALANTWERRFDAAHQSSTVEHRTAQSM